jgi:hypothetical protein
VHRQSIPRSAGRRLCVGFAESDWRRDKSNALARYVIETLHNVWKSFCSLTPERQQLGQTATERAYDKLGTTCFAIHSCFSCKTQFAPLSRQSGLEQGATIFPLFRILVSAHAECWYRPVSGAVVPTTQSMPRCAIKVPRPSVTVLLFHGGPLADHAVALSSPSATNHKMQDQGDHCEDEQ